MRQPLFSFLRRNLAFTTKPPPIINNVRIPNKTASHALKDIEIAVAHISRTETMAKNKDSDLDKVLTLLYRSLILFFEVSIIYANMLIISLQACKTHHSAQLKGDYQHG